MRAQVVIAAPSLHLLEAHRKFHPNVAAAAQDVGFKKGYGAFTGEISAEMLKDAGVRWTLTGHSERRVGFGFQVRQLTTKLPPVTTVCTPLNIHILPTFFA